MTSKFFMVAICFLLCDNLNIPRLVVNSKVGGRNNPSSLADIVRAAMANPHSKKSPAAKDAMNKQRFVCGLANGPSGINSIHGIIGGKATSANEFPWQVHILKKSKSTGFESCGGFLIDSKWVLTAAHCIDKGLDDKVEVRLGSHQMRAITDPNRVIVTSKQTFIHPKWNRDTVYADIALIRLPNDIKFNNNIRPVCLPNSNDPNHVGHSVTLTGWGSTLPSGDVSPVLRKATSTVISTSQCKMKLQKKKTPIIRERDHLCILGGNSGSVCRGDSGGPMNFKNKDGTWTAIGIASFAFSKKCDGTVFTRVSSFLDWIEAVKTSNK